MLVIAWVLKNNKKQDVYEMPLSVSCTREEVRRMLVRRGIQYDGFDTVK